MGSEITNSAPIARRIMGQERRVDEMAITTALANVDSHRFYERHGFQPAFLLCYGKPERSEG